MMVIDWLRAKYDDIRRYLLAYASTKSHAKFL